VNPSTQNETKPPTQNETKQPARNGAKPPKQIGASLLNRPAPPLRRTALDGRTIDLAGLRGRAVLLNFWASWCGPCIREMPLFDQWTAKYGARNFAVIGISIDDDPADAVKAAGRLHIHYPIAMGDEKLGASYGGILGVPVTYLIDRKGIIRARFEGRAEAFLS
jgi:thiol-disulfide isomerase/thioredoxin